MPTLRLLQPDDAALDEVLGSAHQRFARLVAEAEAKARPFYAKIFGEPIGIDEAVARIFRAVADEGDAGVARFNQAFDGASLSADQVRVDQATIEAAWAETDPALQAALTQAVEEISAYQRQLLPSGFGQSLDQPLGARWTPFDRIGGYVPGGAGGSLPLCSTVLMNLVPAAVAGVGEIAMVSPPRADGSLAPQLLAAAHAAGVNEIYRVGGIQAIAALACGTETIPAVHKIVGPGNLFVTLAKRYAYGRVDIDMLAGPSEVMVIADGSCDPAWVAADVLSQAEHDPLAMSMLLTVGEHTAEPILEAVERQLADLPDERRTVAEASVQAGGFAVPCPDQATALALCNQFAPEHLELLVEEPGQWLSEIRHAGAIFVGPWSPEPIGDYVAGPSHTLPTGGTARMWSGIGADTFLKRSSIINLDRTGFERLADSALTLARAEGLEAHARSVAIRLGQ